MPSSDERRVTRRDLLRASSVVGMASLAGCAEQALVSAPSPAPDTWPLANYGPRNTARSPDVSPPSTPTVERFSSTGAATSVVVGGTGETRRILVGGYDGVTAHHQDGTIAWRDDEGPTVAIRPNSRFCYVGGDELQARNLRDGTVQWSVDLPSRSYAIMPSSRGPFVPYNGGINAYDKDGNERYRISRGAGVGYAGVAIDDAVYVTDVGMTERLAPRGLLQQLQDKPPAARWRAEQGINFGQIPILGTDGVYVIDESMDDQKGGVVALDTEGSVRWHRSLGDYPLGAALGPQQLFVTMLDTGTSGDGERLYALDRADGTTNWTLSEFGREDGYYGDTVIAGGSLVVGGATPDRDGFIAAYSFEGERRWMREFESPTRDIAPVKHRIYAATEDGSLYVLS
ncbi:outer membrane protein assembly factor BamB family protein [Halorussus halophilus]|uniref:outer membrane protein assembly factor BamB family protein n=1 Tax=Halorussus halophilus TaxID=2650975 RepID=UPI001301458A|nr:PQQ-binding-like beta-propeller repeat protein [Halorussus halophilus]